MNIAIATRDKHGKACVWRVQCTPEFLPADAIDAVQDELKQTQNFTPSFVLVALPGGKTQ